MLDSYKIQNIVQSFIVSVFCCCPAAGEGTTQFMKLYLEKKLNCTVQHQKTPGVVNLGKLLSL